MAGAAELFTVCRNCGQQVSSFSTECPYCGSRLRRRAPRLERGDDGDLEALLRDSGSDEDHEDAVGNVIPLKRRSRLRPGGGAARRLRRGSGPRRTPSPTLGGSPARRRARAAQSIGERRPWATIVIVAVSLFGLLAVQVAGQGNVVLGAAAETPAWRYPVAVLIYVSVWHELAVLAAFAVFGWLWERRAGWIVPLGTFVVAGIGGLAAANALGVTDLQAGAGGAATALGTAWIVAELRARSRHEDLDGDVIGAVVLVVVALAVCAVVPSGAPVAALIGVPFGALLGLGLAAAGR